MEAATQLSSQGNGTPDQRDKVRVLADRVRIELLEIVDATLAQVIESRRRSGQPPEETVTSAVEIGARVLARESTAADVDLVQREFERVSGEVERAFADRAKLVADELQKRFDEIFASEGGLFGKALDAHATEIGELVAEHFSPERRSAVQNQIEEKVRSLLGESQRDLINHFTADDGRNPLADFKRAVSLAVTEASQRQEKGLTSLGERLGDLRVELTRLQEQQAAQLKLEEVEKRGTAKGRTYEEEVFSAVERIAVARGDVAFHVGDERSAGGGKRGDIVVEIDAAQGEAKGCFVIEAKDERLSKNVAWEVLNSSMAQRGADYGILVVASAAKLPAGRESLHEYEGNKLIVPVERESLGAVQLEYAYRYARCRCLMAREQNLEVDAAGVQAAAEEAVSTLREAQKIRSALTGASKNVDHARDVLDVMVDRVKAQLARIESLVAEAERG